MKKIYAQKFKITPIHCPNLFEDIVPDILDALTKNSGKCWRVTHEANDLRTLSLHAEYLNTNRTLVGGYFYLNTASNKVLGAADGGVVMHELKTNRAEIQFFIYGIGIGLRTHYTGSDLELSFHRFLTTFLAAGQYEVKTIKDSKRVKDAIDKMNVSAIEYIPDDVPAEISSGMIKEVTMRITFKTQHKKEGFASSLLSRVKPLNGLKMRFRGGSPQFIDVSNEFFDSLSLDQIGNYDDLMTQISSNINNNLINFKNISYYRHIQSLHHESPRQ